MPIPVPVALATVLLAVAVVESNTGSRDTDLDAAAGCPLDHVPLNEGVTSHNIEWGSEGGSCRPMTDLECTEKYGNITLFDVNLHRCVWNLPVGSTPPKLQGVSLSAGYTDRCAFMQTLHVMLSTMRPEGIRVIPLSRSGKVVIPTRCGRVNLLPWTADYVVSSNVSPEQLELVDSPPLSNGLNGQRHDMRPPGWVILALVVLSALASASGAASIGLAWLNLFATGAAAPSESGTECLDVVCEERFCHAAYDSAMPCIQQARRFSHQPVSRSLSPSSPTEGTRRPARHLGSLGRARSLPSCSMSLSVFSTPRAAKLAD